MSNHASMSIRGVPWTLTRVVKDWQPLLPHEREQLLKLADDLRAIINAVDLRKKDAGK